MRIEELDFSIDILKSLQWQRNNAVNLTKLIQLKQAWYEENYTQFWQNWFTQVFDLRTATNFGLAVWCIILQVPYFISSAPPVNQPIFGFNQTPPINNNVNFNNGNFATSNFPNFVLDTEDQRIVCQLRYYQLTTDTTMPGINQFMNYIFNNPNGKYQGGAWALDNLDMGMTYVFNCPISTNLYNVLTNYDILARPCGVKLSFVIL